MSRLKLVTACLLVFMVVACGGQPTPPVVDDPPPIDDPRPPEDPPPGDSPAPYSGTLIAEGTGYALTLDLAERNPSCDPWVQRDTVSVYAVADVVLSRNEILIASDSFGSILRVAVKDLSTFGLKENLEWPEDGSVGRVDGLAVSRDGQHLAGLLRGYGPRYLEILSRDDRQVIYSGLPIVSSTAMAWTPDDELVMALDLSREDDPERWGAIGGIPLDNFYNAEGTDININLYATFTRAEWGAGVFGIALSADGSQLAYTRGGDLWVMDFTPGATPHQLTTGPRYHGGAQFSPDGSAIAFMSLFTSYGLTETYIIPNHRGEPLFIDYGQDAGDEYLTGAGTLVDRMLAWAP